MNEALFDMLRVKGYRITEPRKAIIGLLENSHLTFKELQQKMRDLGYNNTATLYNNIDFLIDNHLVTEIFIDNTKYYDLTVNEFTHTFDNHIHVVCRDNHEIYEILDENIFEMIKKHESLRDFDIESIQISIKANSRLPRYGGRN